MGVEDAIRISLEYVKKFFEGQEYRLEEVTVEDDGTFEITVSFHTHGMAGLVVGLARPGVRRTIGVDESRLYKVVSVSPEGAVKGVRIRPITVG